MEHTAGSRVQETAPAVPGHQAAMSSGLQAKIIAALFVTGALGIVGVIVADWHRGNAPRPPENTAPPAAERLAAPPWTSVRPRRLAL